LNLEDFARDLLEGVLSSAETAEEGEFQETAFAQAALEILTDCGECIDPQICYHRSRGAKVNAYDYLGDSDELDIFVVDFDNTPSLRRIGAAEVVESLARCEGVLQRSLLRTWKDLEESSEIFDLAQLIGDVRKSLRCVRVFLLSNRIAPAEVPADVEIEGIPVTRAVWDIERLYQVASLRGGRSPVVVDFVEEFGAPLPCLGSTSEKGGYDAYLALVPGEVLGRIYGRWGQRILERNVRSFLQARGAVNQGIRRTLGEEPSMFLAYNNGISATADRVELAGESGNLAIVRVENLQIVNGGQTTASIYDAHRRRVDLGPVTVQMKLTVLDDPARVDDVVPLISRYANSQTKVSFSDFSANDPFHVNLERLSRQTWAPTVESRGKSTTKWYYERARGQYLDDKGRQETPSKGRAWEAQHPARQKLTKTLVAKYLMSWMQSPHRVSEGAEKNFSHFCIWMRDNPIRVDDGFFHRLIGMAILFQQCDRVVRRMDLGGYKANVVTYTVAWLSYLTAQRLDLERIWLNQGITPTVEARLGVLAERVWKHITEPPANIRNITEWCKRERCWDELRMGDAPELHLDEADVLSGEIPKRGPRSVSVVDDDHSASLVDGVSAETWFALSRWGKETDSLASWERSLSFSIGRLAAQNRPPSAKQALQGRRILDKANARGFKPT
jgi:hypothetical protein